MQSQVRFNRVPTHLLRLSPKQYLTAEVSSADPGVSTPPWRYPGRRLRGFFKEVPLAL